MRDFGTGGSLALRAFLLNSLSFSQKGSRDRGQQQRKPTLSESTTNPKSRENDDKRRDPCSRSVSVDGT